MQLAQGVEATVAGALALQHHAVLAGLGEDGGDLPLAEGVVQRAVDVAHGHAEAPGQVAVDGQIRLQAAALQVAGDVGQLGQRLQRLDQARRPLLEQRRVRRLQAELVLGAADAVLDGQLLHRLQEQLNARHLRQLGAQALDHLGGGEVALAVRLEVDLHASAVEGGVVAVDADVGRQAGHRRIAQDHLGQALLALAHGLEGDALRRLTDALDGPDVLDREKPFGNSHIQHNCETQREQRDQQGLALMAQHPGQAAVVAGDQPVDPGAAGLVEATLFALRLMPEQACAHHRRQGQRHHQRDEDGHRQGDGELAEQPPHHVGHEQQRDQHGDQRQGQRH
ncbi:hypothetical protein D3C84_515800 [compost metagenome]